MKKTRTFPSIIASIKSEIDIIDVIESSGIEIKQSGARYKALCPFHDESTPSFIIDENSQSYHCFGCGEHGDIFTFIQKTNATDFVDSMRILGQRPEVSFDVDTALEEVFDSDDENHIDYKRLRECVEKANNVFLENMKYLIENDQEHEAIQFIKNKGLSFKKASLDIGYADTNKYSLVKKLKDLGFTDEEIIDSGLAFKGKNNELIDFFVHRVMFTFKDNLSRPIGFSGRLLSSEKTTLKGKYVNTGETPLFKKSRLFYGLEAARKEIASSKQVYIVEGQTDVLAMHESGIKNSIATGGTAITDEHIKLIKRIIGNNGKIIFCLDGDIAGINAMKKTILSHNFVQDNGHTAIFPKGNDPCDIFKKLKTQALQDKRVNNKNINIFMKKGYTNFLNKRMQHSSSFISECVLLENGYNKNSIQNLEKDEMYSLINEFSSLFTNINNPVFIDFSTSNFSNLIQVRKTIIEDKIYSLNQEQKKKNYKEKENNKNIHNSYFIPEYIKQDRSEEYINKVISSYNKGKEKEIINLEIKLLKLSLIKPNSVDEQETKESIKNKNFNKIFSMSRKLKKKNIPESYGNYSILVSIILTDEEILPNIVDMNNEEIDNMYRFILSKIKKTQKEEKTSIQREKKMNKIIEAQEKGLSIEDIEKLYKQKQRY